MKQLITKYSGAILLYSVIIFGVFALNARFKYLNENNIEGEKSYTIALGE